jgi:hypothetical protein
MEVYRFDMPLSLQDTHQLLIEENGPYTMDHYLIYSYLRKLGYVVIRSTIYEDVKNRLRKGANSNSQKVTQRPDPRYDIFLRQLTSKN